jgi:flagellar biosynthesis anti-sigma factor FlgM
MKVENNSINPLQPQKPEAAHPVKPSGKVVETAKNAKTDSAELSERAKLLSKAHQAFNATPDVREGRVKEIKVQVDSGNYQIPLNELARRLYKKVI